MPRIISMAACIALIGMMLLAVPAVAQSNSAEASEGLGMKWFDFFVMKGGWPNIPIIALSVVAMALAVEHCVSIRRSTIIPQEAARRIKDLLDERKYVEAVKFASDEPSMLGHVVSAALVEATNGYAAMEIAVQETLEERSARLFRKIEYLNVIGNISPMLGLFGTVYGMILLFAAIHQSDSFPPPRVVSDQISIALITTFWGLLVAIPSLSVFAIFRNRIDVLTAECALAAERILATFKPGAVQAAKPK